MSDLLAGSLKPGWGLSGTHVWGLGDCLLLWELVLSPLASQVVMLVSLEPCCLPSTPCAGPQPGRVVEGKVPFRSPPGRGRSWGWGYREGAGWAGPGQGAHLPGREGGTEGSVAMEARLGLWASQGSPWKPGPSSGLRVKLVSCPCFFPAAPRPAQKVRAQHAPAWVCCEFCGPLQALPRLWLCALAGQRQVGFIQALPK